MKQFLAIGAVATVAILAGCTNNDQSNSTGTASGPTIRDTNIPSMSTNVVMDTNAVSSMSGPTIKNTNIPTLDTNGMPDTNPVSTVSGPTIKETNIPTLTNTNQ